MNQRKSIDGSQLTRLPLSILASGISSGTSPGMSLSYGRAMERATNEPLFKPKGYV